MKANKGYTGRTQLVMDPALPPKTWEKRRGTNSAIERTHRTLTQEEFVACLEDPKCEILAVGEDVHPQLLRVLATPNVKTTAQKTAEAERGVGRPEHPRKRRRGRVRRRRGLDASSNAADTDGRFHLDSGFWGGGPTDPPEAS